MSRPRERPVPLDRALADYARLKDVTVGVVNRGSWDTVTFIFGRGHNCHSLSVTINGNLHDYPNFVAVDDALYDAAVERFDRKLKDLGWNEKEGVA